MSRLNILRHQDWKHLESFIVVACFYFRKAGVFIQCILCIILAHMLVFFSDSVRWDFMLLNPCT